ncbi:MAG TPA: SpoIIE family protein phosphatase [Vicinamibacteria bacterium]
MGNIALHDEAARRRALDKELELAREIQISLLPDVLPDLSTYELVARNAASRTMSGDLYQVFERGDEREHVLLVADVSGNGVRASLVTASLEALAAGPVELGRPPEEIFERISRRLYGRTPLGTYATAILVVLRQEDGMVRYANAGHFPGLVLRDSGDVEKLEATGMPLGLFPSAEYSVREIVLAPGETLVLYGRNPRGEEPRGRGLRPPAARSDLPRESSRARRNTRSRGVEGSRELRPGGTVRRRSHAPRCPPAISARFLGDGPLRGGRSLPRLPLEGIRALPVPPNLCGSKRSLLD